MYQDYKDVADFRLVYIREAHAADSSRPVRYAKDKGINDAKTFEQRCEVAELLIQEKKLTIPTYIDGMDNKANQAYSAWPDRIFLVRNDGRLAVAADRGPWGFKPAVQAAESWLRAYKETGKEPALPAPKKIAPKKEG